MSAGGAARARFDGSDTVAGAGRVAVTSRGPRAQTSAQPENRPSQTTPHWGQWHDSGPARIGWSHPFSIWGPNSWHQPIRGQW